MEVVADVENGSEAIEAFQQHRPDVVVIDLRMQGLSGVETTKKLRELFGDVRVLIFSNYAKGEEVYQAMRAGALGFVLKEMSMSRLMEAIRKVARGEKYLPPEVSMRIGERMLVQLTAREIEVLNLVAKGLSNKQIGTELGVVEGTIKIHIANIFSKMGVSDRTQAIVMASQHGIINID